MSVSTRIGRIRISKRFKSLGKRLSFSRRNRGNRRKGVDVTLNQITYQIRGAAYDVYVELGPGLLESVYEAALAYELRRRGLSVETQKSVPVLYKGENLDLGFRLDMIVEDAVIVELKSVAELTPIHFKQLQTYLRLSDKRVGYLINFNTENILESMHRIANNV